MLDTNVLVSALVFSPGRLGWLRPAWQQGHVVPVLSPETGAELVRVLRYPKFRLTAADREELLTDLLPFCETIVVSNPPPRVPVCRDRDDRKFLELAIAADVEALVSGDADIVSLAAAFAIPILRPDELRGRLNKR